MLKCEKCGAEYAEGTVHECAPAETQTETQPSETQAQQPQA